MSFLITCTRKLAAEGGGGLNMILLVGDLVEFILV